MNLKTEKTVVRYLTKHHWLAMKLIMILRKANSLYIDCCFNFYSAFKFVKITLLKLYVLVIIS